MRLKISARKSDLARLQAYTVGDILKKKSSVTEIEYRFKESLGDINLHDPLWKIPERGVFTEDFFNELVQGETDMVVHSWKDLPTEEKKETFIAATLPRADQRDLLLFKKSELSNLKLNKKLKLFSSSPRRSHNLAPFFKSHFPVKLDDVEFHSVRGNIPTRVRKLLEDKETHGLILAKAAIDRLLSADQPEFFEMQSILRKQLEQLDWMVLPLSVNPNAAAQGALAIEIRKDREDLKLLLSKIHDAETFWSSEAERHCLSEHGGGCHQKIGVSFLRRPYGDIKILKGLTTQGVVLDEFSIKKTESSIKFKASELWSDSTLLGYFDREIIPSVIPENKALYIAKFDAVTTPLPKYKVLWTSGLKTWEKLAAQGYWVHGSSEGLGEHEDSRIEVLASKDIDWYKLSHIDGTKQDIPVIGGYRLKRNSEAFNFAEKKCFFWSSGSLFNAAINEHPEIINKFHASGPGSTAQTIKNALKKAGFESENLHQVFLSEDDWRKQCQE